MTQAAFGNVGRFKREAWHRVWSSLPSEIFASKSHSQHQKQPARKLFVVEGDGPFLLRKWIFITTLCADS
jgi:hypothetical protein